MQSIRIMGRPPLRIRKRNQLSQFSWTSTKVIPIEKLTLATFRQWAKVSKKAAREEPTTLHIDFFRNQEHQSKHDNRVFHAWSYGRFIEIQGNLRRKKLHRTNQGCNFLGGSFSNRDNVRAPIQFRREGQPEHLKRWFFLKNRSTHFHINRTIVIRPVKRNQLSFPSIEINKPLLTPVHRVS